MKPCTFHLKLKKSTPKKFLILQETKTLKRKKRKLSGNGYSETRTLKKLLMFQEVTCKARKTNKQSALKNFLVSYDVFAIFTSVEYMEISYEAKNKTQIYHYQ